MAAAAGAQTHPDSTKNRAGLAGTVRDTLGHPVVLANVSSDTGHASTVTDQAGHFVLSGLAPGTHTVNVAKIGYRPVAFEVQLPKDSMVVIEIHMHAAQVLPGMTVVGERIAPKLAKTGFYERQRQGMGQFMRPEKADSMSYLQHPTDMLREMHGLEIRCPNNPEYCTVQSTSPPHCLWLWIDGVQHDIVEYPVNQLLTTYAVYAIEVYTHAGEVPMDFQGRMPAKSGRGMSNGAGCGALVIWTRSRNAP